MTKARIRLLSATVVVALVAPHNSIRAQLWEKLSNPKINVPIAHPPGLGLLINKVAFGTPTGSGAAEFSDELTSRFVSKNVEVVERERLEALLSEHKFSLSGFVDKDRAAEMGKILGPAVMIFVDFSRNQTEKKPLYRDWKTSKGVPHRTYISRTTVYLKGSIRSVDLATSRIFAARTIEASPSLENTIDDRGQPEYPDANRVFDLAMRSLVDEAERLFLPWTSTTSLYYFDDNECGMKAASTRMKGGDARGAVELSLASVEACNLLPKGKEKAQAHANHNLGMSYFALNEFEKAIDYLNRANSIRAASIHTEALNMVISAQEEQKALQRVEERAAVSSANAERRAASNAAAAAAATVTNTDIVALTQAKLPAAIIVSKIKSSACRFDTGASALIELKKAGVADDVIVAMMECKKWP